MYLLLICVNECDLNKLCAFNNYQSNYCTNDSKQSKFQIPWIFKFYLLTDVHHFQIIIQMNFIFHEPLILLTLNTSLDYVWFQKILREDKSSSTLSLLFELIQNHSFQCLVEYIWLKNDTHTVSQRIFWHLRYQSATNAWFSPIQRTNFNAISCMCRMYFFIYYVYFTWSQ